ncbi:MAG: RNA polymerase sigma factor region1.1 domain-containing protein, partial [Candidatus Bathyarchaeia archaeon]
MIDEDLLSAIEERESEHPALARLIELGRQKGYVTIDDILRFFPEAEQDVDQLEEAFSALINAGIPYVDEA